MLENVYPKGITIREVEKHDGSIELEIGFHVKDFTDFITNNESGGWVNLAIEKLKSEPKKNKYTHIAVFKRRRKMY